VEIGNVKSLLGKFNVQFLLLVQLIVMYENDMKNTSIITTS